MHHASIQVENEGIKASSSCVSHASTTSLSLIATIKIKMWIRHGVGLLDDRFRHINFIIETLNGMGSWKLSLFFVSSLACGRLASQKRLKSLCGEKLKIFAWFLRFVGFNFNFRMWWVSGWEICWSCLMFYSNLHEKIFLFLFKGSKFS